MTLGRAFWLLIGVLPACLAGQARKPGDQRGVPGLIESGKPDDAERAARAGGNAMAVTLGEILVLRGKLPAADSIFRAAVAAKLPAYRSAEAALAELAARRGDRVAAMCLAETVTLAYQQGGGSWPPDDQVAAGRAFAVLGRWDPQAFHDALRAYDHAVAVDSSNVDAELRAADLFLDKYNAPDARASYQLVLARVPDQPRALFGLARADAFEGNPGAMGLLRQSLKSNPALVPALLLLAKQHLDAEAYDSATAAARRALAIDPSAVAGWGVLGAIAWLHGDSADYHTALAAAEREQPAPVDFYAQIAELAAQQRRYSDAVVMANLAVNADSESARAVAVLAYNQLRTGDMVAGRANLDRAFALDPYNLWHKNTLDLLDQVATFKTVSTPRFRIVAPADEADYLALYLGPLLEAAYDSFAIRYQHRPPVPIRVELYGRHADFSVRTVGLTGLGALGVSFGPVLILDSPRAQQTGDLNYGSTAWHELAHTFTLGLSQHRVPRWISEGLSVLEERRAGHGWGFEVSPDFLAAYKGGVLPRASQINDGLVRPTFTNEIGFSYYEASLVCAMIEGEDGIAGIRAMLTAYAEGFDTPAVLQRVLGLTRDAFDQHFDQWLRSRFASALAVIDSSDGTRGATGAYVTMVHRGAALIKSGQIDSARTVLRRAQQLFPEDGTVDGPAWQLAHLDRDQGQLQAAISQIDAVTMRSETAADANDVEATLRLEVGDSAGARDALEREQWIQPYDIGLHQRMAGLSEAMHDMPRAVRERRAIVALGPPDPLEARYQLARTLARAGDRAGARREILQVLEQAPAFEKAQALLLELQGSSP
ncbi:MAG: tetratricopeptide repeat protein [Gemmatimonadales bacterium]